MLGTVSFYASFSTTDLYSWKIQNPPFSEDPQNLINTINTKINTIFVTYNHTWEDCHQLLQVIF